MVPHPCLLDSSSEWSGVAGMTETVMWQVPTHSEGEAREVKQVRETICYATIK
jgi:hypothetical protein